MTRQAFEGRQVSALGDPDIAEYEARTYLMLRVRAYQREMEPFVRLAAHDFACRLRAPLIVDGRLVPPEDPIDQEVRKWLNDADAMVRRYYELEPT